MRALMHRYKLIAEGSGDFNSLTIYSNNGDAEAIKFEHTRIVDIIKTRGFIDDSIVGEVIYEFEIAGKPRFRDRVGALRCLMDLQPQLSPLEAAALAFRLEENISIDITIYGFKKHYWHVEDPLRVL